MEQERELVIRAKEGDQKAFEALVLAHERLVYNLALHMTRHPEDARDVAQEAFFVAFKRISTFKMESSFSTWLYRLASNVCIDFLRREKRRKSSHVSMEEKNGRILDLPDTNQSPQERMENRELLCAVEQGMRKLSQDHREILVLREIGGLSYEEIGAVLQLEPGTVKSRLARARLHLREILIREGNFPDRAASKKTGKEEPV
ncbi:MAG: sigma-70 family RNA polymerase sigma factor [Oscillospiraceae bacterium]|nr:sigma-70 family RNA polymerase sigma factor [Oscillospiraceae bacterium]